ncbi:MAG: branched-chain amino acid ABC transporter permease, partial [Negativicutes bacterium]|nr:branched-chain amino acid ABC transporter permease [Negativicutes bacterium]
MMNKIRKNDIMSLLGCLVLYAVMQLMIMFDIIGPFWELNIVLIGIN